MGKLGLKHYQELPCLEELSLSEINVHRLPDALGRLKHLRRLSLSYNRFTQLSVLAELSQLEGSMRLALCSTRVALPMSCLKLASLKRLKRDDSC